MLRTLMIFAFQDNLNIRNTPNGRKGFLRSGHALFIHQIYWVKLGSTTQVVEYLFKQNIYNESGQVTCSSMKIISSQITSLDPC